MSLENRTATVDGFRCFQLDRGLPDAYDEDLFYRKCDVVYRHVFDAYQSGPSGIYGSA